MITYDLLLHRSSMVLAVNSIVPLRRAGGVISSSSLESVAHARGTASSTRSMSIAKPQELPRRGLGPWSRRACASSRGLEWQGCRPPALISEPRRDPFPWVSSRRSRTDRSSSARPGRGTACVSTRLP